MSDQEISANADCGRPPGEPTSVVRLPDSLLEAVDAWIARQPDPRPARAEAIERLLVEALDGVGAESIPVENLNASNDE